MVGVGRITVGGHPIVGACLDVIRPRSMMAVITVGSSRPKVEARSRVAPCLFASTRQHAKPLASLGAPHDRGRITSKTRDSSRSSAVPSRGRGATFTPRSSRDPTVIARLSRSDQGIWAPRIVGPTPTMLSPLTYCGYSYQGLSRSAIANGRNTVEEVGAKPSQLLFTREYKC